MLKIKKENAQYRYKLKQLLIEQYFKAQEKDKITALNHIAVRNSILLNTITPTFMFEGTLYTDGFFVANPPYKGINLILHHSLKNQVHNVIKGTFDATEERAIIDTLISNILTESNDLQLEDIRNLLPFVDTSLIQPIPLSFVSGIPMSKEKIESIKEKYKTNYTLLNKLQIVNLLSLRS